MGHEVSGQESRCESRHVLVCCVIAEHDTFLASIPAKYDADASDSELQLNARRACTGDAN